MLIARVFATSPGEILVRARCKSEAGQNELVILLRIGPKMGPGSAVRLKTQLLDCAWGQTNSVSQSQFQPGQLSRGSIAP
jgi:hypothetical protein